ncbi:T9SS type A sorting domain-containing protein [Lacibacter sp. MH-610]|uniref:T9SS type A sorting domain-containing protein n=1 Tax=Lacibacter sp. MH-610 TaxID=3020883 RepID=UPI003892548B
MLLIFQSLVSAAQDLFFVQNNARAVVQSNAQATVHGGVQLFNGSLLTNNGTITVKQVGASGASNWTDATVTPYFHGSGTVIFNGTGGHTATSPNRFGRININASGHVTLSSNINTDNLYLTNGRVNTTAAYRMVVLTTPELAVQADVSNTNFANSWVNGTLRRNVNTSAVNNYWFPVGDAVKCNRALLTDLTANPLNNLTYINASFGPKPGTDVNLSVADFTQYAVTVSNGGVWYLDADVQPTAGNFDLLLYFNGFTDLSNNRFSIIRRPLASADAVQWQVPPGSSIDANNTPGRTVASGFARRYNISTLGQFGLGLYSYPLAEEELLLAANRKNEMEVALQWQSNLDLTVAAYELERKVDGEISFKKIYAINSKQVTGIATYDFTDFNNFPQRSWYRIKAVNANGSIQFSPIRFVDGSRSVYHNIKLYPNPASKFFTIQTAEVLLNNEALLFDAAGKLMKRFRLTDVTTVCSVDDLSSGVYTLVIPFTNERNQNFIQKVIIHH